MVRSLLSIFFSRQNNPCALSAAPHRTYALEPSSEPGFSSLNVVQLQEHVCKHTHTVCMCASVHTHHHTHSLGLKLEWIKISVTSLNSKESPSDEKTWGQWTCLMAYWLFESRQNIINVKISKVLHDHKKKEAHALIAERVGVLCQWIPFSFLTV